MFALSIVNQIMSLKPLSEKNTISVVLFTDSENFSRINPPKTCAEYQNATMSSWDQVIEVPSNMLD